MWSAIALFLPLLSWTQPAHGWEYSVKTPPLDTDWTYKVGTSPWPEYPRPQLTRDRWKNLNGVWSYKNAKNAEEVSNPPSGDLGQGVLIPSCLESGLSGIQAEIGTVTYSWFRTEFDVPEEWNDDHVLLNFQAVDYEATVFINGQKATFHRGGYFRFSVDVSQYIKRGETNELVVFVYDPTDSEGDIPLGKQTNNPSHIFYTPCTGIWQTVWLEPIPQTHVKSLDIAADMHGQVNMTVHSSDKSSPSVSVTVYDNSGKSIATGSGSANSPFQFKVDSPQLWSPNSPSLYNMSITLGDDTVGAYTGFRTIEKGEVNGINRHLLNGEVLFAFGTLDQGYWPDGLYTPPTHEAMVYDLQVLKNVSMNMVRKHIKVEPDLWYRACDEMGLLVIQDMPSLQTEVKEDKPNSNQQAEWERQLQLLVEQHRSFPSIYTWVIYNEGWGQLRSAPETYLAPRVRTMDPTRLIDAVSGWNDHGAGDFSDNHHYSNPQCGAPVNSIASSPYDTSRIGFQGEFGGIGHNVSIENLWNNQKAIDAINQTYELDLTLDVWNDRAHVIMTELLSQTKLYACSGGVWTETSDVEGEVNGLVTYDRRILRPDVDQWRTDIEALYEAVKTGGDYWRKHTQEEQEAGGEGDQAGGSGSGFGFGAAFDNMVDMPSVVGEKGSLEGAESLGQLVFSA